MIFVVLGGINIIASHAAAAAAAAALRGKWPCWWGFTLGFLTPEAQGLEPLSPLESVPVTVTVTVSDTFLVSGTSKLQGT